MAKYEKKQEFYEVVTGVNRGSGTDSPFYDASRETRRRTVKTKIEEPKKQPVNLKRWLGIPAAVILGGAAIYGLSQMGDDAPKGPAVTQTIEANPVMKFAPGVIKATTEQDMAAKAVMADRVLSQKIGYFVARTLGTTLQSSASTDQAVDAAIQIVKDSILNDMRHQPFGSNVQTTYLDTHLEFNGMVQSGHGLDMSQLSRSDTLPSQSRKASAIRVMDQALTYFGAVTKAAFNGQTPQEAGMTLNIIGGNIINPSLVRDGEVSAKSISKMNAHFRVAAKGILNHVSEGTPMTEAVYLGVRDSGVGANTTYDRQTDPATAYMLAVLTHDLYGKDKAGQEKVLRAYGNGQKDWHSVLGNTEPRFEIVTPQNAPAIQKAPMVQKRRGASRA